MEAVALNTWEASLHPACVKCIGDRKARYKEQWDKVNCTGIKKDPLEGIDTTGFSQEELLAVTSIFNAWEWGKKEFGIHQRENQEIMTRCTARKKVFRIGRRWGKTQVLVLAALHRMFTTPNKKVLLFTPYEDQIELFFQRVNEWMEKSPAFKSSVKRIVKDPFTMELGNGSYLKGFTTGVKSGNNAGSSRGQEADIIILDEADLLTRGDLTAILPMLQKTNEFSTEQKELWAASTPTGKHDFFYEWCNSSDFKEFHFPSWTNPAWDEQAETDAHNMFPNKVDFDHEYGAEWSEEVEGVYQKTYLERAKEVSQDLIPLGRWDYSRQVPANGCVYIIGVDWNKAANGVQIVVTEYNPTLVADADRELGMKGRFRIVTRESIDSVEFTQTKAVKKIIELNQRWNPAAIYVDEGYGETQIEELRRYGNEHKESDLLHRIKPINFSSTQEVRDPVTKMPVKKHMKPFIVNNSVNFFEKNLIILNLNDSFFEKQLRDYTVEKRSREGRPVYSEGNDHVLDAFNLCLLGYTLEFTDLGRPIHANNMRVAGRMGEKQFEQVAEEDGTVKIKDNRKKHDALIKPRQIWTNDKEQNKMDRAWRNNNYRSSKMNRPIKRSI